MLQLLIDIAPEAKQAGADIALPLLRPQQFGYRSRCLPTPYLQLKESVFGGKTPLRIKQIMLVFGIDMIYPSAIADNFNGLLQPLAGRQHRL